MVAPTWARLKTVTASRCSGAVCSPVSRSEERLVVPEQVMRDVPGQRGGDGCLHHAPAGVGQPAPRSAGGRGEPVRPGQLAFAVPGYRSMNWSAIASRSCPMKSGCGPIVRGRPNRGLAPIAQGRLSPPWPGRASSSLLAVPIPVRLPGSGWCPAGCWCVCCWRGSGGGMWEGRGGLACDFDALCDFDRRIHTSESHEASISHVIQLARRGRTGPAGTGVADAVTVPCAADRSPECRFVPLCPCRTRGSRQRQRQLPAGRTTTRHRFAQLDRHDIS